MTSILQRDPASSLATAVGGSGAYLLDAQGKAYLDASGGAAVSILGHGHPAPIAAICRQAQAMAYAHTAFFTNAPAERLAERLVALAPPGLGAVYFASGGSEANETALKLARQYQLARGEPGRSLIIYRRQSYHGATLATLAVSGNPARRAPYEPMLPRSPAIMPCHAYRHAREGESLAEFGARAAADLERAILQAGPSRVAAFIMEPVVGATLGAAPAAPGYTREVRAICDRYGVLLIADEIMCGMGRTGRLFASAAEGVTPDILTIAKGLAAGYQPLGAVLLHERIREAILAGPGRFEHGHTYIGHATACAAGLAVLEVLTEGGLLERVQPIGAALREELDAAFAKHPHVGDIRGRGAFLGIEIVEDRASKRPFARQRNISGMIKRTAMEEGLIVYPGQGCADGHEGDHILLAPPYIWEPSHIDELVSKLARVLEMVLARQNAAD